MTKCFIFRIPGVNFGTLLQAVQEGRDEVVKEVTDVIALEGIRTECCKSQVGMLENYLKLSDKCIVTKLVASRHDLEDWGLLHFLCRFCSLRRSYSIFLMRF
jgi:hypothetical protein